MRHLKSPCRRLIAIDMQMDFRWYFWEVSERAKLAPRFLRAIGDRAAFQPRFADERLVPRLDPGL